MALAAIIIATFIFPIAILLMLLGWRKSIRKEVQRHNENKLRLIKTLERIITLKNKLINLLRY
ncbi:hypothetical protein SAMN05660236_0851 [Ohtaekwangia koreensis]|uniref:Uncharacterized protein n=1 Tax=Ohtaekwangia koreensis TaxID=688867 RepID=A0A1T5J811_9BACT|nr:hypothetical protein SAMN05660236_0851 [Ohtaekwangia koreensis]